MEDDMLPPGRDNDYSDELDEAWELFAEDGKEALDLVEDALLALESNPTVQDQIILLFRGLHKFKGNARMMGLSALEHLFHQAEDLAALVRDEGVRLTGEMIELLLEVVDRSREMLGDILARRCEFGAEQLEDLVRRLGEMLETYARPQPQPVATVTVDLRSDPLYMRIFLEMLRDEMERLPPLLGTIAAGHRTQETEECIQKVRAIADTLSYAAGRLGYTELSYALHNLVEVVESLPDDGRYAGLDEAVQAILKELAKIEEAAHRLGVDVHIDLPLSRDCSAVVVYSTASS